MCGCGSSKSPGAPAGAAGTGSGASGANTSGGAPGSGGASSAAGAGSGGTSSGTGGADTAGTGGTLNPIDLCDGLITDREPHPMTPLTKPALGEAVTDAEFGTTLRRISEVSGGDGSPAIRPLYSTVAAWNADESRLILLDVEGGTHRLYDGKTYASMGPLDISPADVEQVYWHTSDPDILFYVHGVAFVRYHVATKKKEVLTEFGFCDENASGGSDPMFTSFDSKRIGLHCGDQVFIYDIAENKVLGRQTLDENPAQVAPSGTLAFRSDAGHVTDLDLKVLRTLDLKEPWGHASMGRWPTGEDTWNGQVFDEGPNGNDDIGSLVTWDLTRGDSKVIIGPKTGYPYPPDGHISAMAWKRPGWVFVSTFGDTSGAGLLDMEMLIANTVSGKVCRVGRHRSWGKANQKLGEPYWAEPHTVPSPSGTRAVFASDWGNGSTVDTYVLELPAYRP
jgi:hypothetical protein